MSKYPCKLIEDIIPLYIEEDISYETKEIVEEHLKECENCKALVDEYSKDELKLEELKADFTEDLPKASTFKGWMKRLKILGILAIAVFVFIIITIGALGYKIGKTSEGDFLTEKSIVNTFKKQGVTLRKDKSKDVKDYQLEGVEPAVYNVGDNNDTLLVYIFDSFVQREEIVKKASKFHDPYNFEVKDYNAKNAYLVYISSKTPQTEEDMKDIFNTKESISNIVFKELNGGKEFVFKGSSENWEGTFTQKYYEHWWEDEKGAAHYEGYTEKFPIIKYKGTDIDAVGSINYEYKTPMSSGSGTGLELNKEGIIKLGGGGSDSNVLREDADISFKIQWNGKEENITLKPLR